MKKRIGMAVIVASVFAASSAMAAQQGMWEMSVAGNIENSSSTYDAGGFSSTQDTTSTFVNVNVGKYFTPKLVGQVNLSLFGSDSGGAKSTGTAVGAGVKYYFGEAAKAQWVPFVDGGVNVVQFESGGTTVSGAGLVGGGGVSYFITEEVSGDISGQLFYNFMSGGGFDVTQSGVRLLFGLTVRY